MASAPIYRYRQELVGLLVVVLKSSPSPRSKDWARDGRQPRGQEKSEMRIPRDKKKKSAGPREKRDMHSNDSSSWRCSDAAPHAPSSSHLCQPGQLLNSTRLDSPPSSRRLNSLFQIDHLCAQPKRPAVALSSDHAPATTTLTTQKI